MGNIPYRRSPITDCEFVEGSFRNMMYGAACMQGWRRSQEDTFVCIPYPQFYSNLSYFAVFDGHGGPEVAEYLRETLHNFIRNYLKDGATIEFALGLSFADCDNSILDQETAKDLERLAEEALNVPLIRNVLRDLQPPESDMDDSSDNAGPSQEACSQSRRNSFKPGVIEHLMYGKLEEEDESDTDYEMEDDSSSSSSSDSNASTSTEDAEKVRRMKLGVQDGSTATVVLIDSDKIYMANVGDSRCVLSRKGVAIDLSVDHKPEDEIEQDRILKAGGTVSEDGRINDTLNLSRAFGDFIFKCNKSVPENEQIVISEPHITTVNIEPDHDFLVIASDGIWNAMSSQEVVDYVMIRSKDTNVLKDICEELFHTVIAADRKGDGTGMDNMTIIIIKLNISDSFAGQVVDLTGEKIGSPCSDDSDFPPIEPIYRSEPKEATLDHTDGENPPDVNNGCFVVDNMPNQCVILPVVSNNVAFYTQGTIYGNLNVADVIGALNLLPAEDKEEVYKLIMEKLNKYYYPQCEENSEVEIVNELISVKGPSTTRSAINKDNVKTRERSFSPKCKSPVEVPPISTIMKEKLEEGSYFQNDEELVEVWKDEHCSFNSSSEKESSSAKKDSEETDDVDESSSCVEEGSDQKYRDDSEVRENIDDSYAYLKLNTSELGENPYGSGRKGDLEEESKHAVEKYEPADEASELDSSVVEVEVSEENASEVDNWEEGDVSNRENNESEEDNAPEHSVTSHTDDSVTGISETENGSSTLKEEQAENLTPAANVPCSNAYHVQAAVADNENSSGDLTSDDIEKSDVPTPESHHEEVSATPASILQIFKQSFSSDNSTTPDKRMKRKNVEEEPTIKKKVTDDKTI